MLLEEADDQASASAANLAKNPLVSAILDACETLKKLQAAAAEGAGAADAKTSSNKNSNINNNAKQAFSGEALASAKGLIFMRTDKVGVCWSQEKVAWGGEGARGLPQQTRDRRRPATGGRRRESAARTGARL